MDRGQVMAMREFIENFESGGFESGLYDDFEVRFKLLFFYGYLYNQFNFLLIEIEVL